MQPASVPFPWTGGCCLCRYCFTPGCHVLPTHIIVSARNACTKRFTEWPHSVVEALVIFVKERCLRASGQESSRVEARVLVCARMELISRDGFRQFVRMCRRSLKQGRFRSDSLEALTK